MLQSDRPTVRPAELHLQRRRQHKRGLTAGRRDTGAFCQSATHLKDAGLFCTGGTRGIPSTPRSYLLSMHESLTFCVAKWNLAPQKKQKTKQQHTRGSGGALGMQTTSKKKKMSIRKLHEKNRGGKKREKQPIAPSPPSPTSHTSPSLPPSAAASMMRRIKLCAPCKHSKGVWRFGTQIERTHVRVETGSSLEEEKKRERKKKKVSPCAELHDPMAEE